MPPLTHPRRGAGLAELVVALALSALLSMAGVAALIGVERYTRRAAVDDDAQRVLREVESVLAAELRAAAADSITVRGDTAVDLFTGVATSVVCAVAGAVLVLPSDQAASGVPYLHVRTTPLAGDVLAAYDTAGAWHAARVDSAQWNADGAGCSTASGFRTAADSVARLRVLRLRIATELTVGAGAPVRLFRRGRYALIRGGDGSWGLGWRRCDELGVCGASQPVAGPLAAPSEGGLVFQLAADGGSIEVRAATSPAGGYGARREFTIALRHRETVP
ncbi:MAG: hypothetical protein HY084_05430 [Gemmatimonadetes bacterium]|nr:hypothetical protein [Gemmatimonadota bacterium]